MAKPKIGLSTIAEMLNREALRCDGLILILYGHDFPPEWGA